MVEREWGQDIFVGGEEHWVPAQFVGKADWDNKVVDAIFDESRKDPLDAFYLLNSNCDLNGTQVEFEDWFRDQNMEGKARSAPITKELAVALKSHDLFICFGHRTVGSTVIVANLWEVTDKDIDRFGKAILDACLRERSSISVGCDQCTLLVEEFEAKNVRGCKGQKKKVSRKKLTETLDTSLCKNGCDHRPKLGSFMGQAREACTLPFLVEASLVCYGVQTGIRRQAAS
ncbi:hypothetical protein QYF36_012011 [Acer negundo]|nr:hypothetical protein QYF36_012011 [Acer negundo]